LKGVCLWVFLYPEPIGKNDKDKTECLQNSKLDTVAKAFELEEQKTDLTPKEWVEAMLLDSDALDSVVEHCTQDVKVLRELFPTLSPFVVNVHK